MKLAPAKLAMSPTSHDFGASVVGTSSSSQSFAITNTGKTASGTLALSIGGPDAGDFAVDANSCAGGPLSAGAACSVTVHFAPTATGTRKAALTVTGAPGGTVRANLQGTGSAARLVMSPSSHQYGTVTIGASSASQTYTVTNTGAGPSGPLTVAIGGTNASEFVQDATTCGTAISAGSACSVTIHFTPTAAGSRSATLTVTGTPGGSVKAQLRGSGASKALLTLSPATFDYGPVTIGASSAAKTFTVTNAGQGPSGLVTLALGGTDAAAFHQDSTTCGAKLAVGASCTVTVHFAPTAAASDSGALSVTASPGGTATAQLHGTGATAAVLAISPATFDFGGVGSGTISADQTFTVTNTGQGDSGAVTPTVSGAGFGITGTTCGGTLAGGASCTIAVHFAPAATGAATGTLAATATPGGTATAQLQGTGLAAANLTIAPTTFDFGQAALGTASTDQVFTVTNTGGAASGPVTVTSGGTNAAAFVIGTTTCATQLAGGASCLVVVHFAPTSGGTSAGSLSATATPGGTATASLQGESSTPAALAISPTSANLGQTTIGVATPATTFTVTNTGQTASGTVTVALGGANPSPYSISTDTCTGVLAAGASCTLNVTFDSFSTGTFNATLTATGAPGGSAAASLTAQAIVPAYFNGNSTLDFGSVLLSGSSPTQVITVKNFGQQTTGVLNAALGGTNPGDFAIDADTCAGTTLVGGASCTITVHFTPTALGARSATIKTSGSPGGIQTNTLQGSGVDSLTVTPSAYTFPDQHVGTTSASVDFTLTNYTTSTMSISALSSTDPGDFPITADSCVNGPLASGASCVVSVAFRATVLGQHSTTMTATFLDSGSVSHAATFTLSGTSIVPPPDLATAMSVTSQNFNGASVLITVTNLGSAASVPATMTVDVNPTQSFSYSAGLGTDCTASFVNGWDSQFTCPIPAIAINGSYTRTLTINNLSSQAPHYIQNDATTVMPGDTNSSNNTAYADVTLN